MRGVGGDFHASASPYPTLYTRFLSVVCGLPLLFGRLSGQYHSVQDFIVSYYVSPTRVLLWARLASALMGTLGVLLTFFVGRKIFGERVGLAGALLLAASAQQGAASHFAVPDIAQSALILAAYLSLCNALTRGTRRDYVASGLLIGLGAATGYMAALLLPTLLFSVLLRNRKVATNSADRIEREQNEAILAPPVTKPVLESATGAILPRPEQRVTYSNLTAGLLAAMLAFGVVTPTTLLSPMCAWAAFRAGLASDFAGNGSGGAMYTLSQALTTDWGTLALVAALAGVGLVLRARKAAGLLFLSFPACYALALGLLRAQAGHVLVALDPFIALFGGVALCRLYDIVRTALANRNRPVLGWKIVWTFLVVCVALLPLWTLLQWDSLLGNTPDTRTQALKWAEQTIPPGSMVCLQTPRPVFQSISAQPTAINTARAEAGIAPNGGANAPLLTEAGLARADVELSHTPFADARSRTNAALRQRATYRETAWTWPPPPPAILQQAGVEYLFTSDACGPLPAAWQSEMEKAARGGILHFTPGSIASSLPPGLPALPPRITVYILRDAARP